LVTNVYAANLCSDGSFAARGLSFANGSNTFTATAKDSLGRTAANTLSVTLSTNASFTYDGNGNLTGDGRRVFVYDDENQLTSVTVSNVFQSIFVYDGRLRCRVVTNFVWTGGTRVIAGEIHYLYDGMTVVQERDGSNLPRVTYTRGNDLSGSLQGAGGIGGLLARTDHSTAVPTHAFYHSDGNGNVTALVNQQQAIVARYTYDPYGNLLAKAGPLADANTYRFSSKEWQPNAGLYYYGYRFYEPNLQRWLNRDPLTCIPLTLRSRRTGRMPQVPGELLVGPNSYQLVGNRPVNAVDPLGLWGIQFGDVNIGICGPSLAFDRSSWGDLGRGAAATADGIIPFADPFRKCYNPCDPIFKKSKALGALGRDIAFAAAIPNLSSWVENPLLYEIGQKTLSAGNYAKYADLGVIARGQALVNDAGWIGALLPESGGWGLGIGSTFLTGPTPGGWLAIGIGFQIGDTLTW
jgi:RHS repeat-associated protein